MNVPTVKQVPTAEEAEASFRAMLEDVGDFAERMTAYCHSVEELAFLAKHGVENPGALRLLMAQIVKK
jgi:hypothetical protein